MKKIVSLVLILAMMAVIATGCGGSSNKGGSDAQAPAQAAETAEASDKTAAENKEETVNVNNDGYVVLVTDSEGAPVVGAAVQFCSDTQCMMEKTDDTGCAVFKVDPGKYTVHILKAAGYVVPEEEFAVPEQYDVVRITLEKQ